jgi:hypothetical protein
MAPGSARINIVPARHNKTCIAHNKHTGCDLRTHGDTTRREIYRRGRGPPPSGELGVCVFKLSAGFSTFLGARALKQIINALALAPTLGVCVHYLRFHSGLSCTRSSVVWLNVGSAEETFSRRLTLLITKMQPAWLFARNSSLLCVERVLSPLLIVSAHLHTCTLAIVCLLAVVGERARGSWKKSVRTTSLARRFAHAPLTAANRPLSTTLAIWRRCQSAQQRGLRAHRFVFTSQSACSVTML